MHLSPYLQTDQALALLITTIIFLFTILLVVKRWIGFGITFLLLLFCLGAGLAISSRRTIQCYLENCHSVSKTDDSHLMFMDEMQQAITHMRGEVETEKETLHRLVNQVQDIFDQVDFQRQKLQHFIEDTRNHLKPNKEEAASEESTTSAS